MEKRKKTDKCKCGRTFGTEELANAGLCGRCYWTDFNESWVRSGRTAKDWENNRSSYIRGGKID